MNLDTYSKETLWKLLVETVHTSVMYSPHKAYTRDTVLQETPDVTPDELARRLNMSLGAALVILEELANQQKPSS